MLKKTPIFLVLFTLFIAGARSFVYAQEGIPILPDAETLRSDAVQMAREGNVSQALSLMEKAMRTYGYTPEFLYDYVVMLSWAGRHTEAIKNFEDLQVSQTAPDYVLPEAAASYRRVGEYNKAIKLYLKYLILYPEKRAAIQGIISCCLDTGKTEEALRFLNRFGEKHPDAVMMMKPIYADVLFQKGNISQALQLYAEAFRENIDDEHTQMGIIRVLIAQGRGLDVEQCINTILEKGPDNYDALICKGEILEAKKEYLLAYKYYGRILALFPQSAVAKRLQYRALIRLGCTSLVKELLEMDNVQSDALEIITLNGLEINQMQEKNPNQNYLGSALLRNYYDGVETLSGYENMQEVIRQYKMLEAIGISIPPWTLIKAADAHLYLKQPEEALMLYNKVLEQKWDPEGLTRISIYYTLIELGKYKEAGFKLDTLDKDTPAQIVLRGILRPNWQKEDIAVNRGWCLLYQDRLSEAQTYLRDLLSKAPANTHIRTALAQTYLWRGWPRLALEEFQINYNLDEQDTIIDIGKGLALNENDQGYEARKQAKELNALYPENKHILQLNRYFSIEDMRTLTINAQYSAEHPGANGTTWSTRIDQPIFPWRGIFAEYIWRRNHENGNNDLTRRFFAGTDWRLTRDWWFTGGLSFGHDGTNAGHFENFTFTPDDYWLFNAGYDSYIIDLPLRAAAGGVTAEEYSMRARYRASENFIAQLSAAYNKFSDRNKRMTYGATADTALTTAAYWKTRLEFEGFAQINSETNVDYFSPSDLYSFYVIPMVEHVWFRRYERALIDRFYAGIGMQSQQDYGWNDVWYVRYEMDHQISDLWNILIGTTYAQKNYDGEDLNVWTADLIFKRHF